MAEITVDIAEQRLATLRDLAAESGLSAEEFLRTCIDDWLVRREKDFAQTADYVLRKNAELYRRLA